MMLSSPPSRPSPITPTVDFDRDGVQHGHLRLPWSRDDSAWGSLMLPICVIRNGDGPTALLTGGNHGDEYEGPVALYDLAANLKPAGDQRTRYHCSCNEFSSFHGGNTHIADR